MNPSIQWVHNEHNVHNVQRTLYTMKTLEGLHGVVLNNGHLEHAQTYCCPTITIAETQTQG